MPFLWRVILYGFCLHRLVSASLYRQSRPLLARWLINKWFNGVDIFGTLQRVPTLVARRDKNNSVETHIFRGTIEYILFLAPPKVTFWMEIGSYRGKSAALVADILKGMGHRNVTIACLDTYAAYTHEDIGENGLSTTLQEFTTRISDQGHSDVVVPLVGSSIGTLREFRRLAVLDRLPKLPDVIYIDASHAYSDTILEVEYAWSLLAPGGVMFGDDWAWLDDDAEHIIKEQDRHSFWITDQWNDTAVQKALIRWAALRQDELDDSLKSTGIVHRVRHGLFLSKTTWQWIVRKHTFWKPAPLLEVFLAPRSNNVSIGSKTQETPWDCFSGEWNERKKNCCADGSRQSCWDDVHSKGLCC